MILLTGMDGKTFMLNSELIEKIEEMPDNTVITLVNTRKYLVQEELEAIRDRVIQYKSIINNESF